ncbi:MAG: DMT family transporter [Ruminococcaceae bacterium]|nr:DMT family transporter [Oscillospiraceae bacterium]
MTKQHRAELLLALATGFWSISYYFSRVCLTEMDVMTLNAFRFLSAFMILGLIYRAHLRHLTRETVKWGVAVGLILVVTYIGATYGVMYTSLSNAGFISCLAVVITPLIQLLFFHRLPERRLGISLLLCVIGLALMTLSDDLRFASGDALCLLCSVAYACDILVTEHAVTKSDVDPVGMCVVQIGVTGACFLLLALLLEKPHLPLTPGGWAAALFLGLFCSGITFIIQNTQQQYTSAARVALIFTLEPLFSAIVAFFLAGERLLPRNYFGAALMLISLLLAQTGGEKHDDVREGV